MACEVTILLGAMETGGGSEAVLLLFLGTDEMCYCWCHQTHIPEFKESGKKKLKIEDHRGQIKMTII